MLVVSDRRWRKERELLEDLIYSSPLFFLRLQYRYVIVRSKIRNLTKGKMIVENLSQAPPPGAVPEFQGAPPILCEDSEIIQRPLDEPDQTEYRLQTAPYMYALTSKPPVGWQTCSIHAQAAHPPTNTATFAMPLP